MSHIALIFGGPSAEHDVSLVSAKCIYQVLKETQLQTHLLGISKSKQWKLVKPEDLLTTSFESPLDLETVGLPVELKNNNGGVFIADQQGVSGPLAAAFPIIHGPYGENGELQTELHQLGLEFVGCDFLSCENCFDKGKTKEILARHNIKQVPYRIFCEENPEFDQLQKELGLPLFVKPANMGSSIGISKVKNETEFLKAIAEARIHDKKIIIEKGVKGRELECALLEKPDLQCSGVGEVRPHHEFYSYEAKYLDPNGAELLIPAPIDQSIADEIRQTALAAFKALDCRDFARADFFLDEEGEIYFNEINTHPGFTTISQFPMLWQQEGMTYKDLILTLVQRAIKRSEGR